MGGIYSNAGYDRDPLVPGKYYRYQDDIWIFADFSPYDSVSVYFSVQARFWNRLESRLQENPIILPLGEDRFYTLMKIEVLHDE
jgi:hypothetical protein